MKMPRALLVSVCLVAVAASPIVAQNARVGVRAGVDFASLSEELEETDSRTTFAIGGFAHLQLSDLFAIQPELQYARKGATDEEQDAGFVLELTLELDYIELLVPIVLTIPVEGAQVIPRIYVAPALGLEVNCAVSGEVEGISASVDCDSPELEDGLETKSVDFGVLFGGGVDIPAGPGFITGDVRYNLGLTDINDSPFVTSSIKNRNFQVMAGYAFTVR